MMPPIFTISRTPGASKQIRDLTERARTLGMAQGVTVALSEIVSPLENDPLHFGEPAFNTRRPGGVVCTGIVQPLKTTFAVFEADKVVFASCVAHAKITPRVNQWR